MRIRKILVCFALRSAWCTPKVFDEMRIRRKKSSLFCLFVFNFRYPITYPSYFMTFMSNTTEFIRKGCFSYICEFDRMPEIMTVHGNFFCMN